MAWFSRFSAGLDGGSLRALAQAGLFEFREVGRRDNYSNRPASCACLALLYVKVG
jgi:hypothetical protein